MIDTEQQNVKTSQAFFIRIMFSQNATYQGEISWLEKQKTVKFRSLLEMIMQIQEAMADVGSFEIDYNFFSGKKMVGWLEK